MIKECQVIANTNKYTVVRFDDMDIQFPPINRTTKTVKVLYQDNKYKVVPDDYKEIQQKPKKSYKKKFEIKGIEEFDDNNY